VSRGKLFVEHEGKQIDIASCTPAELKMMRTQRIAMVFQKFALMPWLTVRENISFGPGNAGPSGEGTAQTGR
jgi:glycine betaine/proline transport system ATP-binding protein